MIDVIDHLVEDALRELADERRQRELWLSAGPPEVSSFTECVSRLWYDSGLSAALERPLPVYRADIDAQFQELRALLRKIDGMRAPQDVLGDPRLHQARGRARQLLDDLRRFGSGPES